MPAAGEDFAAGIVVSLATVDVDSSLSMAHGWTPAVQRVGAFGEVLVLMDWIAWRSTDLAGGPVDEIFASLWARFPGLSMRRLWFSNPNDDDNVWRILREDTGLDVQVDTCPDGAPPFLLESDYSQRHVNSADEAVEILVEWFDTMTGTPWHM
ncbi:hypothetical protein [Nocardia sp. XZ_19_385]|uniref:hypothetical protein n=1 Tax=Nocardia sp. XZ_19_385 TaxID=2769488 RepID=UPI00189007D7|nr:hypothetical protein [Nocardia sp. XZ_19_385]